MFGVRFAAEDLAPHREINFTRRYGERWEGQDYRIGMGEE
jgi:hypothetical protein